MADARKPIRFLGGALDDLKSFPLDLRSEAGHQLSRVQLGLEPADWKPMGTVGAGAFEIRVRGPAGAFRVIYVAKLGAFVFVLHCFQKKTAKTSASDLSIARTRYKEIEK